MGYYGASKYRGDFRAGRRGIIMRGGFHPAMLRGDFLDDLGNALGTVGGYIDKGLQYVPAIGSIVNAATRGFGNTIAPSPAMQAPSMLPALPALPALPGIQMVAQKGYRGGTPAIKVPAGIAALAGGRHHRRMNPLNVKALRRSLRRADAFLHVAKKYVKVLKPGHHVELKATHHHKKR